MAERLCALGVYPFLVPFTPIAGTPMEGHAPPPSATMQSLYADVARLLRVHGLSSAEMKAGCARCGACSALSSYEASPC
jgi:biotin synthase-related radical SAM superfamily protein